MNLGPVIRVAFTTAQGETVSAEGEAGDSLLRLRQAQGLPLEGTCEGQMACSTCHVIVAAEDFDKLPRASEEEDDLLDLAAHVTRHSRLACQIILTETLESLTVRIPPGANNMMRR